MSLTATIIIWAIIHVIFIAGLGCLAFLLPSSSLGGVLDDEPKPGFVPTYGTAFFSNSTGPFPPVDMSTTSLNPDVIRGRLYLGDRGQMRFENLDFRTGDLYFLYLCNDSVVNPQLGLPTVSTRASYLLVSARCLLVPVFADFAPPSPTNGSLFYRGSYNFIYGGVRTIGPTQVVLDPAVYDFWNKTVVVVTRFQAQQLFSVTPVLFQSVTLGNGTSSQQTDPRAAFGAGYDTAQALLLWALFFLFVCILSMLLTYEKRLRQSITTIVLCCAFFNTMLVALQSVPQDFKQGNACVIQGFFQVRIFDVFFSLLSFFLLPPWLTSPDSISAPFP